MATKFNITREKSKKDDDSHYVVKKEWQKEREHVMKLEKELKAHEKTDITHAHPRHSPSAGMSQPQAGIPALRKG
jgi:hypothetical protein